VLITRSQSTAGFREGDSRETQDKKSGKGEKGTGNRGKGERRRENGERRKEHLIPRPVSLASG
jgi:hypothetical protein